jgi:hypothetical protein
MKRSEGAARTYRVSDIIMVESVVHLRNDEQVALPAFYTIQKSMPLY